VRAVRHTPLRLKEASKLGFKAAVLPAAAEAGAERDPLQRRGLAHVRDLLDVLPPPPP
jgi:predicted ATP-dependent serine protease